MFTSLELFIWKDCYIRRELDLSEGIVEISRLTRIGYRFWRVEDLFDEVGAC